MKWTGLPKRQVLRFSVRGYDGERVHALVATMRRQKKSMLALDAEKPQWKCIRLELQRGGGDKPLHTRALNPRKLNRSEREDLAEQAERAACYRIGIRINGEGQ